MDFLADLFLDSIKDTIKLVPFLFVTYAFMEYLSHKAGDKVNGLLSKAGRLGPVVGGTLGLVPQCGFSAAASTFFAGRLISVGTLMAVYLSTSDEMLPIMLSSRVPVPEILKILALKAGIGILAGMILEIFLPLKRKKIRAKGAANGYKNGFCQCKGSVIWSAVVRTLQIAGFLFAVTFALGFALQYVSMEQIFAAFGERKIIGPVVCSLIGLIPNCASSVMLTTLYLDRALSLGAMTAGLLVNAGVGLLVLFRVNKNKRESLMILLGLYGIGAVSGILLNVIGFH